MLLRASDLSEKALLLARFVPEHKPKSTGNLAMSVGFAGNIAAGTSSVMTASCWHLQEARNARLYEGNRSNRRVCSYGVLDVRHSIYCNGRTGKMRLNKLDEIDEIFEKTEHQADALVAIYKSVFPEWDAIEKIKGWPSCGKELWEYICEKFIQFDKVHHGDVMAGGLWMNNGFSCNKELKPWKIDKSSAKITYRPVLKAA